jgi:hypothetical protein
MPHKATVTGISETTFDSNFTFTANAYAEDTSSIVVQGIQCHSDQWWFWVQQYKFTHIRIQQSW